MWFGRAATAAIADNRPPAISYRCHVIELSEFRQATERLHQTIWCAIET